MEASAERGLAANFVVEIEGAASSRTPVRSRERPCPDVLSTTPTAGTTE